MLLRCQPVWVHVAANDDTSCLASSWVRHAFCHGPRRAAWCAFAAFGPLCAWGTFFDARAGYYAEVFWFFAVFLLVGYLKHHTRFFQRAPRFGCLVAALAVYAALVGTVLVASHVSPSPIAHAAAHCKSPVDQGLYGIFGKRLARSPTNLHKHWKRASFLFLRSPILVLNLA